MTRTSRDGSKASQDHRRRRHRRRSARSDRSGGSAAGPPTHFRAVAAAWVVVAVGLGVLAPRAEHGAVGGRLGGDRLRVRAGARS